MPGYYSIPSLGIAWPAFPGTGGRKNKNDGVPPLEGSTVSLPFAPCLALGKNQTKGMFQPVLLTGTPFCPSTEKERPSTAISGMENFPCRGPSLSPDP